MKIFNVVLVIVCFSGFGSTIQAQSSIPASGGNASGGGGTVSYSIGQLVYTTNTSATYGSVARGVQQPFEISVITAIEQTEFITLVCSVYPNPARDYLNLKIENSDNKSLSYRLFDDKGKLLESK
jgi:hypothetical protein